MGAIDTLRMIYEHVVTTDNPDLYIFRSTEHDVYGVIDKFGNIVIPEYMQYESIKLRFNGNDTFINFIKDGDVYNYIARVNFIKDKYISKIIHRSKAYALYRLTKRSIVLASENGVGIIKQDGSRLNNTNYLNVIEYKRLKILIGVRFLYMEKGMRTPTRSIDILNEYGKIKANSIKDLSINNLGKYYVPESILYRRDAASIDFKKVNGIATWIVDGYTYRLFE